MTESFDFDVAIVGGGIAGPAMACALAATNWRVLLVERSAEDIDTARGDHLQPKTCEWLEDWGVLDDMWRQGAEKRLGARYLLPDGEVVFEVPAEHLDIPHPYFLYLNHERISEVLLAGAARNPNFELWRPASALPEDGHDGFGMSVDHEGRRKRVRAGLIVAADGRSSRFRRAAGIEAESYAYRNPLLTLFARRCIDDPRNDVRAYFSEAGVISVIPRIQGGWKIGLPVPPTDLARWKRASADELSQQFSQWLPELDGVRPEFVGVYPVTSMNAQRWSEKNLVLLGDACNTLHPGRSQGMNVAMRAAHRLAQLLTMDGAMPSADTLRDLLVTFEAEVKPPMDARLADNHQQGLQMDRLEAEEIRAMQSRLAAVAADPAMQARYCMASAGY